MQNQKRERVVVALSGGVDSAVAAALMLDKGYDLQALTLKLYDIERDDLDLCPRSCCSPEDIAKACQVAEQLEIKFHLINGKEIFNEKVIRPFIDSYLNGLTPNPCMVCNKYIKFDFLLQRAEALNAKRIISGHYAQIRWDQEKEIYRLFKAKNRAKDQAYFLAWLNQKQLAKIDFPLGQMDKEEVRAIAQEKGLVVKQKRESQDICFLGNLGIDEFIRKKTTIKQQDGAIIHVEKGEIGRHRGSFKYTIGQRRGINIGWPEPLYVVAIDSKKNIIYVAERDKMAIRSFVVNNLHWVAGQVDENLERLKVKVRSRGLEKDCKIKLLENNRAEVSYLEEENSVTPGQAAVFYRQDEIIAASWIESFTSLKSWPEYR